ncbi:hypothetical protein Ae201684_014838 [Aphanomyces euteiches]|uniref:Uncharacterized protein n=1 Tax=Aphanomyces euteiches TaxID=100861 RepID=A0A6G0WIQ6_9STRA|nr:hypothetical protein Ae201684_014838 [Aphanomyces euteiches]
MDCKNRAHQARGSIVTTNLDLTNYFDREIQCQVDMPGCFVSIENIGVYRIAFVKMIASAFCYQCSRDIQGTTGNYCRSRY